MRLHCPHQLQQRFQKDSSFRQQMQQAQRNYRQKRILTPKVQLKCCLQPFPPDRMFYYAYSLADVSLPNTYSKFISCFGSPPTSSYTLVVFNEFSNHYDCFRAVFLLLPLPFYLHLNKMIVVGTTFYQRAVEYIVFGTISKYVKSKTIFYANAAEMCEHEHIDKLHFDKFVPKTLKLGFGGEVDIAQNRMNITESFKNTQEKAEKKKFEAQIEMMVSKMPHLLEEYEISSVGVPQILQLFVYYFQKHPQGLLQEGIFRKSVSIDEETETFTNIRKGNYNEINNITNPYLVANLIKRFFANLKIPIVPFKQFSILMNAAPTMHTLQKIVSSLPKLNQVTLMFLFQFLRENVISKSKVNLMTQKNISVVFSPCLMHAEKVTVADIQYAAKTVTVIEQMFTFFEQIFGSNQKRIAIYKSNYFQRRNTIKTCVVEEITLQQAKKKNIIEEDHQGKEKFIQEIIRQSLKNIQHLQSQTLKQKQLKKQTKEKQYKQLDEQKQLIKKKSSKQQQKQQKIKQYTQQQEPIVELYKQNIKTRQFEDEASLQNVNNFDLFTLPASQNQLSLQNDNQRNLQIKQISVRSSKFKSSIQERQPPKQKINYSSQQSQNKFKSRLNLFKSVIKKE